MADRAVAGRDPEELHRHDRPAEAGRGRRGPGRTKGRSPGAPAHRLRETSAPDTARGTTSREDLGRRAAGNRSGARRRSCPRGASTTTRSETSTFWARANPSAARVGLPSASNAAAAAGPRTSANRSSCRSRQAASEHDEPAGRGVGLDGVRRPAPPAREPRRDPRARAPAAPPAASRAGISSVRISRRKSWRVHLGDVEASGLTRGPEDEALLRRGSGSVPETAADPLLPRRRAETQARAQAQARSRTRRIRPTRSVADTAPRASRMLNWWEQASVAS